MTALIQASFDSPEETRNFDPPSSGHLDLVADGKVGRGTFNPGWRWSVNVKPIAGTELCEQAQRRLHGLGPDDRPGQGRR